MNELARLRGSERYGACDDAVQDALFKGQSCWGCRPQAAGAKPLTAPSESAKALLIWRTQDGMSKVLLRYSWKE